MKEKFKIIRTIYFALLAGIILAFIFGHEVNLKTIGEISESQYIYLLIPIAGIIGSQLLFEFNIKKLKSNIENESKIGEYQTASLMRWAVLEGAAFFSIFDDEAPQINAVIIIAFFILIYPTFDKFTQVVGDI